MHPFSPLRTASTLLCLCLTLTMVGCASKPTNPTGKKVNVPATYRVKSGDTVGKIAQTYNLDWRDISKLNNLDSNHTIYAGQLLKLPRKGANHTATQAPPPTRTTTPTPTRTPAVVYTQETRIVPTSSPAPTLPTTPIIAPLASETNSAPVIVPPPTTAPNNMPIITVDEVMQFDYPVGKENRMVKGFGQPLQNGTTEGMFFSGKAGDTIYASSAGTVIYANNAPNHRPMIMIEHPKGYISTYFDVNEVQVKNGQKVNKGDKLGVMVIQTQDGRALFEFRIAKQGRYIDPISVLK